MNYRQRMDFVYALEGVSPSEKAMLLVLAKHADEKTLMCWPGWTLLKRKSGIRSNDGINATIKSLERRGLLHVKRPPPHAGRDQASVYTLLFADSRMLRQAEHSQKHECSDSTPGMLRLGPGNAPLGGDQPLRTIYEPSAPIGARPNGAAPGARSKSHAGPAEESPEHRKLRQLIKVAEDLRWYRKPDESEPDYLARIAQQNQQRISQQP